MKRSIRGFTLVELNLAMVFVAILVVGVAATTISVTKINQRGIMLKTINQTGREVVDQLRRDIAAARTDQVEFVFPGGGGGRRGPAAGSGPSSLCLGSVSYVFNTAEALHSSPGTLIRDTTQAGSPAITLVRMDDKDGVWCAQSGGVFTKNQVVATDAPIELLQTDLLPVAVHEMDVRSLAQTVDGNTAQGLIMITLLLGTNEANTIETSGACKPPTDHQADFDNCAVREFRTVVRSSGVN